METAEKLSPRPPIAAPQSRDPREMGRAELEAYLQNTECFPTKVSLLEFARSHDIPVNARTQREEIIRLCLRMIHDIPASFAGLRDAERKPKTTRASGTETRKVLANFFAESKPGEHADSQRIKKITTALLEGILNCQDTGLLLAQTHGTDVEGPRQALEACENPLEAHGRFLSNLIDLLRLEAGQRDLAHTSLRLCTCIGEALKEVASSAHKKGLELCCSIRADTPECVFGDPGRLHQILINLLERAIESTDSGAVVIEVGRNDPDDQASAGEEGHEPPQVALQFTIHDPREGTSRPSREKLREMKQHGSSKKSSGQFSLEDELGLLLAQRLVELMGGRMEIANEDEKGFNCSFFIRFSVENSNNGEPFTQLVDLRGRPILIGDDNETQRRILDELLTSWGAKVTLAVNGREMLALLDNQPEADPFAVIVMDGQMEDVEGFASIQRQRITEDSNWVSPVIMMFASTVSAQQTERYRGLNVAAFLQKPLTPAELSQALHKTLVTSLLSPDEEVFNRQTLWSFVDGDSALLRELIGLFDQDCPRLFFALQHAILAKHGQHVVACASALRGVVSTFAARGVLHILALVEDLGRRDDFTNVQEALPRLTLELSRLKLALDALGEELSSLQKTEKFLSCRNKSPYGQETSARPEPVASAQESQVLLVFPDE